MQLEPEPTHPNPMGQNLKTHTCTEPGKPPAKPGPQPVAIPCGIEHWSVKMAERCLLYDIN